MKLKERRTLLVVNEIREAIWNSDRDIGVSILPEMDIFSDIKSKYSEEELSYAFRWLLGIGYLALFNNKDTSGGYKLTFSGYNDWLLPHESINSKNIFISYSHENSKLADAIKNQLEQMGFIVFLAHKDIKISYKWLDKIISELNGCNVFVGLVTKSYTESTYCLEELGFALALDKKIFNFCINWDKKTSMEKALGFCSIYQSQKIHSNVHKEQVDEIVNYCKKQLINI